MKYVEFFFDNFPAFFIISMVVFMYFVVKGAEVSQREREAECVKTEMRVETRAGWKHIYDCSKDSK